MVLNSLGGAFQRQGRFEESVEVFERSATIEEQIGNQRGEAMVLNSLGGVFHRQGRFSDAEKAYERSARIEEKLENQRGQAMVLNSLGGVYQRQGRFAEAVQAFQQSYELLVAMGDELGQAMVLFSHGKALLSRRRWEEAVVKLRNSFHINELLKNHQGMRIVTPSLIQGLTSLGQNYLAIEYCSRALVVAPDDKRLLTLQKQLSQNRPVDKRSMHKQGHIKKIIRTLAGYFYGFIVPDDGSEDIYFGEDQVEIELLPNLAEGLEVVAEVNLTTRGPRAMRVWRN